MVGFVAGLVRLVSDVDEQGFGVVRDCRLHQLDLAPQDRTRTGGLSGGLFHKHVRMGLNGCPVTDRRMPPAPVVEDFDVFEQRRPGLPPRPEPGPVNQLGLERAEERFHRRIVVAVALAAHGGPQAMAVEDLAVRAAGVLGGFKRSSQQPLVALPYRWIGASRPAPRPGFSSPGFCGAWC